MSWRVLLVAVLVAVAGGLIYAAVRYVVLIDEAMEEEAAGNLRAKDTAAKRGDGKMRVLFLCTGNSCRSQMAEGWARALKGDVIEPYSAGVAPKGLNPRAAAVMREAGVDISQHTSKTVEDLAPVGFDVVVTVCGHADENCPRFPGRTRIVHVPFDDPPELTEDFESEEETLAIYRRVRDEIRAFVETLPDAIREDTGG